MVEDLRIGEAMSEGPALFGAIYSFDVDAWGRIFVLDSQAEEVRIFDSGGTFVRTVGRRGEGPGEFTQAGSVDLSRNGEIWVMGMGQGRISIFDTTGTYLRGIHGLALLGDRYRVEASHRSLRTLGDDDRRRGAANRYEGS